jgi:hypothetical protein
MHSESRIKPFRRGLAPKMILILCAAGLLVLAIIFLGTSMNRKPSPVAKAITPVAAPAPAPATPIAAVDEASLDPATVRVTPGRFDFGLMAPGSITSRTVQLRNVGSKPIEVLGSKKSCSCTMVDVTPTVLQPGDEIPVTATMTAGLRQADKSTVKVILQYATHAPTTIGVEGLISLPVKVEPSDIRMHSKGYDDPAYRTKGLIQLTSADKKPFRVIRSGGKDSVFLLPVVDSTTLSLKHQLRWSLEGYDSETGLNESGELVPEFWMVETDHPGAPLVGVPLNHRIHRLQPRGSRPWFTIDRFGVIDPVDAGGSVDFMLPLNGNRLPTTSDPVYMVDSDTPAFRAELISSTPGPDGKVMNLLIRITPAGTTSGPYTGKLLLKSANWEAPFSVIGFVRDPKGS